MRESVEEGQHRHAVGGLWEEMGRLQLAFLKEQGVMPQTRVLDIGCGCLRAGVHLVDYLEAGHYAGTDISQSLLDAGYDVELAEKGLQAKLPRHHLMVDGAFHFQGLPFSPEVALAQSLFTHLPLNYLRLCLYRLRSRMAAAGRFYATFFITQDIDRWVEPLNHSPGDIVTYPDKDPYHYLARDIELAGKDTGWDAQIIGDWNHPRAQHMVCFHAT